MALLLLIATASCRSCAFDEIVLDPPPRLTKVKVHHPLYQDLMVLMQRKRRMRFRWRDRIEPGKARWQLFWSGRCYRACGAPSLEVHSEPWLAREVCGPALRGWDSKPRPEGVAPAEQGQGRYLDVMGRGWDGTAVPVSFTCTMTLRTHRGRVSPLCGRSAALVSILARDGECDV